MSEIALRAEGIGKRFRIGQIRDSHPTLRDAFARNVAEAGRRLRTGRRFKEPAPEIWAVRDVSFQMKQGEILGIVGNNGAGKSTLLKILSRIVEPTTGHAEIRGRLGSLLEVGTGFHPELTGRENIFLNGAILGMGRAEIRERFDEIVEFAEVARFIDTPLKRYSSGMYLRLAFAVAAHLEPEILLVDEVLAVGDASFQRKCIGKMSEVARGGRTIIFVSHNMAAIRRLCHSALLLENGRIVEAGAANEVIRSYLKKSESSLETRITERTDRTGSGRVRFHSLEVFDEYGEPQPYGVTGEDVEFRLTLTSDQPGELPVALDYEIMIRSPEGDPITTLTSFFTGRSLDRIERTIELRCRVPRLPLLAADYRVDLWCAIAEEVVDHLQDAALLRVHTGNYFGEEAEGRMPDARYHGLFVMPHSWHLEGQKEAP